MQLAEIILVTLVQRIHGRAELLQLQVEKQQMRVILKSRTTSKFQMSVSLLQHCIIQHTLKYGKKREFCNLKGETV